MHRRIDTASRLPPETVAMNRDLSLTGKFKLSDLETILETPVRGLLHVSEENTDRAQVYCTTERVRARCQAYAREREPAHLGISECSMSCRPPGR